MNPTTIQARLHQSLPSLHLEDEPPAEIQWMPPGEHEISALQGGEPVTRRIQVTEDSALRMRELLRSLRDQAASGREDRPYIDFNHEDREAAGHILDFHWGGDDPVTGGVRATVDWSAPGREALLGRAFRRFSPSFFVNANGEVTGAPLNMGGLVNRAAFKTIQPIWSRDQSIPQPSIPMEQSDPLKTTQTALAAAQVELAAVKARLAAHESGEAVRARDTEIAQLHARVAGLEGQVRAHRSERAQARVHNAIRAGRLAPQATEVHARWITLIEADERNAELLEAMPVNAALATVVHNWNGGPPTTSSGGGPEAFAALVKAKTAQGVNRSQALDRAMTENPEAYRAWREAGGRPGL